MDEERLYDQPGPTEDDNTEAALEEDRSDGTVSVKDTCSNSLTLVMHSGLGIDSPFTREIFLTKQAIVGMRFQGGSDDLLEDLEPGSRITFIREPENRYDPHAIMALDAQGRRLGYIPRLNNPILSSLMDAGKYLYGIVSDEPGDRNPYGRNTPTALYVDLYLREFSAPDDLTQIPLQGYRGSYAVMDLDFTDDPEDPKVCGVFVIKVINGEERGIHTEEISDDSEPSEKDYENLIRNLQAYIGYLPVVGYHISGKVQKVLENAWGVYTGRPFSNQVIDIRVMAWNRFQNNWEQSLDGLAERLGITVNCDTPQETYCRQILQIYCRLDRSELERRRDTISGTLTQEKYQTELDLPLSEIRMTQRLRDRLEDSGIDILWEISVLSREEAFDLVGEECIRELEELLSEAGTTFKPEDSKNTLYGYPRTILETINNGGDYVRNLLVFEIFIFRYHQLQKVRTQQVRMRERESYLQIRTFTDFNEIVRPELQTLADIITKCDELINKINHGLSCQDEIDYFNEIFSATSEYITQYKRMMAHIRKLRCVYATEKIQDVLEDLAGVWEQLCENSVDDFYNKMVVARQKMLDCAAGKIRAAELDVDLTVSLKLDFDNLKLKMLILGVVLPREREPMKDDEEE